MSKPGLLSVLARVAAKEGKWEEACKYQSEAISQLEERRIKYEELSELDLYDSRYNKHYLEAIELFLEAKNFNAALNLIDRTRFRSGCDVLEGIKKLDSPLDENSLSIPLLNKDEIILEEWIYPKYDWSFSIKPYSKGISVKKIKTSETKKAPVKLDIHTEWSKHFKNILKQTQYVIDAYQDDLEKIKRILFIPHGTQFHAPFAALTHPKTKEFLAKTHELLIVPSLRYLNITDNKANINSKECLVIGDPTGDLPGAREEAKHIAEKLNCNPILGKEATKRAILEILTGNSFNIVHYSGHGSYDEYGLHSLILSDGNLTTEDILSAKFTANIVNLASCWGGIVTSGAWNELHGFIRSLLISGVGNVIGSIYPIGDKEAYDFNLDFYYNYEQQYETPSKAFQSAITSISDRFPPNRWGSLYMTGKRITLA